jgi:glucose-6-phosphate 1-dehydrogenase
MPKQRVDSCAIMIFGATGDLMKRKLIPALYQMYKAGTLTDKSPIIGISRRSLSKEEFIDLLEIDKFLPERDERVLSGFLGLLHPVRLDLTGEGGGDRLYKSYREIKEKHSCSGNKLFYLALPPDSFENAVRLLQSSKLLAVPGWNRVVFEKPFGHDLKSAIELNHFIKTVFKEEEIYRIDHFLGKELVQSILIFRFGNSIFEQIWNNQCVDNVQITVAETIGVEQRGSYYDSNGAIRDMLQNHILQVLSLVAMEEPESMDADRIRNEKVRIFRQLKRIPPKDLIIGQYDEGHINGEKVTSYRMEPTVDPGSLTETFVAAKIFVNNQRWRGVPFYVRTGKRLRTSYSEIDLILKDISSPFFIDEQMNYRPNVVTVRIQPDEGLILIFNAKYPGREMRLHPVIMDFCHQCEFQMYSPSAYQTLLTQAMIGDQTLFARWDGVEASWELIDPLFGMLKERRDLLPLYPAGSNGPKEADELLIRDGRRWILPKESMREDHEHARFWEV